jgi:putative acetyltransferase
MFDGGNGLLIRDERPDDFENIDALTLAAFAPMPFSDGTEAAIIRKLRATGDLTLSLVAEEAGELGGHVAFSPVTIDGDHRGWFGLGPIAVDANRQRRGIGRALVARGLDMLRQRGAGGCALIGDPAVYSRYGFLSGRLTYRDLDASLVQHFAFREDAPHGELRFAPAFEP